MFEYVGSPIKRKLNKSVAVFERRMHDRLKREEALVTAHVQQANDQQDDSDSVVEDDDADTKSKCCRLGYKRIYQRSVLSIWKRGVVILGVKSNSLVNQS